MADKALEKRIAALEARLAALETSEPAFLKDCRTDYFSQGLQGGGVRITHLPTGLSAEGHARAGLKDLARELAGDLARMLAERGDITDAEAQAALAHPPPAIPVPPESDAVFLARLKRVWPDLVLWHRRMEAANGRARYYRG